MNPTGSCLCDSDSHCASNQYCGWGTNSGKCQKRSRGARCARAAASASPTTAVGRSPAPERPETQGSPP
ncbi:MAG TPA: Dickkopf N-terminal cysteine-rich domain-containing protein [Archangium sp.]|nr:Dickkopf N-terminal cysteine-rich domain-containing protein [Archangium sp.]